MEVVNPLLVEESDLPRGPFELPCWHRREQFLEHLLTMVFTLQQAKA